MDAAAPGGVMINPAFDMWGGGAGGWGDVASQQQSPAPAEMTWEGQLLLPSGDGGVSISAASPVKWEGGGGSAPRIQIKASVPEGCSVLVEPLSGGCQHAALLHGAWQAKHHQLVAPGGQAGSVSGGRPAGPALARNPHAQLPVWRPPHHGLDARRPSHTWCMPTR
jgi:hypothetical protein